jgi:hypothetical protein
VILAGVVILSSVAGRAVSSAISHDGRLWQLRKWLRGGTGVVFAALIAVTASHYLLALAGARDIGLSATVDGLSMLFSQLVVERTGPLLATGDWTVLGVVLAAALAAFVVCYRPDTEAPTHEGSRPGRRTRRERALVLRQLRKVNEKVDQAEADVTANLKRAKAAIGKYARLVDAARRLPAKQSDYDYALENACNLLLDRYRAENIRARTTEAPHSFQEHVCFRTEIEGGPAASAGEEHHLEALQQGLRKLESQAGQVRQELRALNSRAIHTLEESARQG